MNVEAAALRFSEQPNKPDRVLVEGIGEIEGEAVAVDAETGRRPSEQGHRQRRQAEAGPRLAVLVLENGAQDAGQIADVLGHPEVVLHEALDTAGARTIGVAEAVGDDVLEIEGEPFFRSPRDVMQMTAHGPQEVLRLFELPAVGGGKNAAPGQVADVFDPVEILGDPEERLQVPETALAVLDVRFQDVA